MKKKAMLSQPMGGKTDEEIVATREKAVAYLESMGYEVVNTYFTDEWKCSECGSKFELVTATIDEYGEVSWIPLKPLYCSVCGAEVNK